MNLYDKPESVLTHGGHSKEALRATIGQVSRHSADQHEAIYAGAVQEDNNNSPARHMDYLLEMVPGTAPVPNDSEFPMHLHSKTIHGDSFTVNNETEYRNAMESGLWDETPVEKVKDAPQGEVTNV